MWGKGRLAAVRLNGHVKSSREDPEGLMYCGEESEEASVLVGQFGFLMLPEYQQAASN